MPHSWRAYEIAKDLTELLIRGNHIERKDEDMVRGIIQIQLEDKYEI